MPRPNQLLQAIDPIKHYLESNDAWAFTERRLTLIIIANRSEWGISSSRPVKKIIEFLLQKQLLIENTIRLENTSIRIFSWKTKDEFTLISGLKHNGYFCYYSATFLLGLTQQLPRTYYLNHEHSDPIYRQGTFKLTQDDIDAAFSGEQRKSGLVYQLGNKKVILTNSKYTGRLGLVLNKNENQCFYHTDLERTLIDCTVRPAYAGGVAEVLGAFKKALKQLDVEKLYHYLQELDYAYPYIQAIGFYLEKAGFSKDQLALFDSEKEFDFYLTYNISIKSYDSRWRLYYPRGL